MCVEERVMGACTAYNPMSSDISMRDTEDVYEDNDELNKDMVSHDREELMIDYMAERYKSLSDREEHFRLRKALMDFVHEKNLHYKSYC
mmetsp:Transcript_12624/g.18135  ORF Transcript_12624/g.18135 Transcript_12624/m.18135 type:complete len:89 (+) Transcript_12624:356-622(+)